MTERLLVAGDSVPEGARTDGAAWPARLGDRFASVAVTASMGWELAETGDQALAALDASESDVPSGVHGTTVSVQAGHNDCQLSNGEPRVPLDAFAATAREIDARLADDERVARHAFVGLLPMGLREGVSFAGDQPARSERYDDRLAAAVETHLSIRDAADWARATVDGVHPTDDGHAAIADRVRAWLDG